MALGIAASKAAGLRQNFGTIQSHCMLVRRRAMEWKRRN